MIKDYGRYYETSTVLFIAALLQGLALPPSLKSVIEVFIMLWILAGVYVGMKLTCISKFQIDRESFNTEVAPLGPVGSYGNAYYAMLKYSQCIFSKVGYIAHDMTMVLALEFFFDTPKSIKKHQHHLMIHKFYAFLCNSKASITLYLLNDANNSRAIVFFVCYRWVSTIAFLFTSWLGWNNLHSMICFRELK